MNYTKVKCWQVKTAVCDFDRISTQEPELQLVKKTINKNGDRAYCLNDREEIEQKQWYRNYLEGDRSGCDKSPRRFFWFLESASKTFI